MKSKVIKIEAGVFQMGSKEWGPDNLRPVRNIKINSFFMKETMVTFKEWKIVYEWALNNGFTFVYDNMSMGAHKDECGNKTHTENEPVASLCWYDAVAWCNAASIKENLTPCYYTNQNYSEIYKGGKIDIKNEWVKWEVDGYRLPTEAEWEYACRAGSVTKFFWGDNVSDDYAWHEPNSSGKTHPVREKSPNKFGLYDICGNIWEWTWDWLADYDVNDLDNPKGANKGDEKVLRGNSFNFGGGWHMPSAYRTTEPPHVNKSHLGLRVLKTK